MLLFFLCGMPAVLRQCLYVPVSNVNIVKCGVQKILKKIGIEMLPYCMKEKLKLCFCYPYLWYSFYRFWKLKCL